MAKFFNIPFANSGDKTTIPDTDPGDGTVSYTSGFGADYQRSYGTDPLAKTVNRQSFNQFAYDVTAALAYLQLNGFMDWQSGLSGGYPIGAVVRFTDNKNYVNTVANNTNAPNVSGWLIFDPSVFVHKTGDTMTGNLVFASGIKIQGDFSNATAANRTVLQTSIANNGTTVGVIPNGSGNVSLFLAANSSDISNSGLGYIGCSASAVDIVSSAYGTGTMLPMRFSTNNLERMRIDTAGNIGIGNNNPTHKLDIIGEAGNGVPALVVRPDNNVGIAFNVQRSSDGSGTLTCGSGSNHGLRLMAASAERLQIDITGNVLAINSVGLGYGTGSGGTVTQLTSKSTSVTLNKPTGQITMNNAALAAGAEVYFTVSNSLCTGAETIICNAFNNANYSIRTQFVISGSFNIAVTNKTGGSLSEAVVITFAIIKGAIA